MRGCNYSLQGAKFCKFVMSWPSGKEVLPLGGPSHLMVADCLVELICASSVYIHQARTHAVA